MVVYRAGKESNWPIRESSSELRGETSSRNVQKSCLFLSMLCRLLHMSYKMSYTKAVVDELWPLSLERVLNSPVWIEKLENGGFKESWNSWTVNTRTFYEKAKQTCSLWCSEPCALVDTLMLYFLLVYAFLWTLNNPMWVNTVIWNWN